MVAPLSPDRLARRPDPATFPFAPAADLPPIEVAKAAAKAGPRRRTGGGKA